MSASVADPAQVLEAYRAAVREIIKGRAVWQWFEASMQARGRVEGFMHRGFPGAYVVFDLAEEALEKADPAFFAIAKADQKPIPVDETDLEAGVNTA